MTPETVENMTTIIASGTVLKGEMTFAGPVRISGRLEGIVHAEDLLEIAPEGFVQGEIHGTFVDIQGTVKGSIDATKSCRLSASARITGELRAANLAIAEGAAFSGKVFVGEENAPEAPAAAPEPIQAAQPVLHVQHSPAHYSAPAPRVELPSPVSVLQNRLEQMAEEAEQISVAAQMNAPANSNANEPQVRINSVAVQNALNRQPRIIKATR